MILSDEEIYAAVDAASLSFKKHKFSICGQTITPLDDPQYHFACAIEAAVLAKLREQEPRPLPELPNGVVKSPDLGWLYDRFQMQQYAIKYANPMLK